MQVDFPQANRLAIHIMAASSERAEFCGKTYKNGDGGKNEVERPPSRWVAEEDAHARKGIFMIDASGGFMKDGPKNRLPAT